MLAIEKAQKQAQREDTIAQRLANLQLSNEQRAIAKGQKKKPQKRHYQGSSPSRDAKTIERPVVVEQEIPTSRSGRQLRRPRHLDSCQL